jgi:hypothetical protein
MGSEISKSSNKNSNDVTIASIFTDDFVNDGVISYTHFNGFKESQLFFRRSSAATSAPCSQFRLDSVKNIVRGNLLNDEDLLRVSFSNQTSSEIKIRAYIKDGFFCENDEFVASEKCGVWKPNTNYLMNDIVVSSQGTLRNVMVYRCTSEGTSHLTAEPQWPSVVGNTISDGTITWTAIDNYYEFPVHAEFIETPSTTVSPGIFKLKIKYVKSENDKIELQNLKFLPPN